MESSHSCKLLFFFQNKASIANSSDNEFIDIVYFISSSPKPIMRNSNLNRIEKKIEKSSIRPIIAFDQEDMK